MQGVSVDVSSHDGKYLYPEGVQFHCAGRWNVLEAIAAWDPATSPGPTGHVFGAKHSSRVS